MHVSVRKECHKGNIWSMNRRPICGARPFARRFFFAETMWVMYSHTQADDACSRHIRGFLAKRFPGNAPSGKREEGVANRKTWQEGMAKFFKRSIGVSVYQSAGMPATALALPCRAVSFRSFG